MNCFPCFGSNKSDAEEDGEEGRLPIAQPKEPLLPSHSHENTQIVDTSKIAAKAYTFREMAIATKNFRQECLMFDDGFGKIYKGTLKPSGEVVAIKQLDRNGMKGSKEFLEDVAALSPLKHPNLINLLGYCADGEQKILVYEHMSFGSLEAHLLDRPADESPLDWTTRMKIATGAAQGLQYLHDEANPPVIYRDFKSANILLDEEFNPRLCDFGLAKVAESGSTSCLPPRVMGTYGHSAPEYASSGELTLKSDVYSFGVVLLELISGRRAIDPDRPPNEQNLITWAQPIFRDPRRFFEMADPLLMLDFSVKSLNQAVGIAAMCLQEEPTVRPYIGDVVAALSFLDFSANDPPASSPPTGIESKRDSNDGDKSDVEKDHNVDNDSDDDESNNSSDDEENVIKNDNEDDKCSSPLDHEDNNNKELSVNISLENKQNENISETHDEHGASFSNDNVNMKEVHDDMSGYSMDDEDTALVIELDHKNGSSDILLDQEYDDDDDDDDDDDEIEAITRTKLSNSKKDKVVEISDDESIYSPSSSGSSCSSIDYKLGEKKTTQKAKSTKKSSVGNSSRKNSSNRWRKAELVLNHETEN